MKQTKTYINVSMKIAQIFSNVEITPSPQNFHPYLFGILLWFCYIFLELIWFFTFMATLAFSTYGSVSPGREFWPF